MSHLYQALSEGVDQWRKEGYANESYPAITEILQYALTDDEPAQLRYLRQAQLLALETYWYLRLELNTVTIPELYDALFPKPKDRRIALGLDHPDIVSLIADEGWDEVIEQIKTDNDFVRKYKLESLRETLTLDYPSYILALAMGAGKTILMGTIVATEFALAQEYPEDNFVKNSLIFAPGKTIIESLREIADIPFDKILPARFCKMFMANMKLTFTRDGDKELPIVWGSEWNIVVTNTEKIRIQKPNIRNTPQLPLQFDNKAEQKTEEANLRLQAIASLPNLAVFSDEAHHTYGQKLLGKWQKKRDTGEVSFNISGIKKVRRTVDFLSQNTNLILVVNTTGTPYFERQPLRDVVVWYGLGQGIRDGILKELAAGIRTIGLDEDDGDHLLDYIITDFHQDYWNVNLPDGSPARLALYFPNTDTRDKLRPAVDSALAKLGIGADVVIAVDAKSNEQTRRAFHRIANDPTSPYRIILLVNMGTEGWNCPSLFACGLVRKLKNSNNFVLQAATRCLRQVPGNTHPARVYVSKSNVKMLEKQLVETYGTTLNALDSRKNERIEQEIILKKPDLPPILLKRKVLRFVRKPMLEQAPLIFSLPTVEYEHKAQVEKWTIAEPREGVTKLTRLDGGEDTIEFEPFKHTQWSAASELAANYQLSTQDVLNALRETYGNNGEIPEHHLHELGQQIEDQRSQYDSYEETEEVALALIKPEGFIKSIKDGKTVYTARISFTKERAHLYKTAEQLPDTDTARQFSFHYEGYNFDSEPETQLLERLLNLVQEHPEKIDGIWFTGGLTDPNKTGLYAEYLGEDKRWHRYTPDFVIRRNDGKHLVLEVKNDQHSADIRSDLQRHASGEAPKSKEGRKAVALKRWENLNPDLLRYEVVFANGQLHSDALDVAQRFITEKV